MLVVGLLSMIVVVIMCTCRRTEGEQGLAVHLIGSHLSAPYPCWAPAPPHPPPQVLLWLRQAPLSCPNWPLYQLTCKVGLFWEHLSEWTLLKEPSSLIRLWYHQLLRQLLQKLSAVVMKLLKKLRRASLSLVREGLTGSLTLKKRRAHRLSLLRRLVGPTFVLHQMHAPGSMYESFEVCAVSMRSRTVRKHRKATCRVFSCTHSTALHILSRITVQSVCIGYDAQASINPSPLRQGMQLMTYRPRHAYSYTSLKLLST